MWNGRRQGSPGQCSESAAASLNGWGLDRVWHWKHGATVPPQPVPAPATEGGRGKGRSGKGKGCGGEEEERDVKCELHKTWQSPCRQAYLESLEQEPTLAISHVCVFAECFVEEPEAEVTADLRPTTVTMTTHTPG